MCIRDSSGGGALVCPDEATKQRIMYFATQARQSYPYYQHVDIGYNYRMSNICAGIGRGQMTVLGGHLAHHRRLARFYAQAFSQVEGIEFHDNPNDQCDSNFWLSAITLSPQLRVKGQSEVYHAVVDKAVGGAAGVVMQATDAHTSCEPNANVEAMRVALEREGIESRPLWKPMHLQPVYAGCPAYVNGVSQSLFKVGLCLPSGPMVTLDDARHVVASILDNLA